MKTTIDIPEQLLKETIKRTGAKTKREAVVSALEQLNRYERLRELNGKLRGRFADFMTQQDLELMREDAKWDNSTYCSPFIS